MVLQVLQEDLSKVLATAIHFVNTRQTLPVLSNFLLTAEKTKLKIQATNLEMSLSVSIGAKVEIEGTVTVPAKAFLEIISNLNQGQLTLNLVKEQLKIESPGFKADIPTTPANDFPKVPENVDQKLAFPISSDVLLPTLSKILFATGSDETRPVLTGVLFIFDNELLSLVSSDGFRLSQKNISLLKKISEDKIHLIIPKSALLELIKLTGSTESVLFEPRISDKQLIIKVGEICLSSRLIEGNFPDFEKIIPKNTSTKILVDKNDLKRGVKLAAVFAREAGNVIKLKVKKSSLEIESENGKIGKENYEAEAKVEITAAGTNDLEISFNYKFIEDFLNSVTGTDIEIKLIDGASPAIFVDPKDEGFLHLIMPVKVQN